jgi:hypothetical protein
MIPNISDSLKTHIQERVDKHGSITLYAIQFHGIIRLVLLL